VIWFALAAICLYINLILWVSEREYAYPKWGPLAYYTFYWGFFVYWSLAVMVYSLLRVNGVRF